MTRRSGKSSARVFQSLIVEDPMKRCAPFGGGLVRSACSKAEISFSHLPKSWGACADLPVSELTNRIIEERCTNPGYLIILNTTLPRGKNATKVDSAEKGMILVVEELEKVVACAKWQRIRILLGMGQR